MIADGGPARDIEQQTLQALQAFQDGRLQEAEAICRDILAARPASFGALHLTGAVAALKGDVPAAATYLREAVKLNPQSAEARGNLAEVLRRAGDLDAAAEQIAEALKLETRIQENYNRLGLVRIGQGRYEEAIACFRQAIILNPDYADAWHNVGFGLEKQSRWSDAIEAYDRALALDSRRIDSQTNLGACLLKLGDLERATAAFRSALALEPQHRPALIGLATALDRGNRPESIDVLAQVAALSPDDHAIQAAYGEALIHLGRFEEATRTFENAIARAGHRPDLVYGLVLCRKVSQVDRELIDGMIGASRAADLSSADRGTLHYAIGKAFDDLGQYSRAIAHFDEANRHWRVGRSFDRTGHSRTVDDMLANIDRAAIETLKPFASASDLPVFVVGLPRSGTTLVEQILARHPAIGAGGEIEYWLQQVEALQIGLTRTLPLDRLANVARDYVSLLEKDAQGTRRVVDKMPHNYAWLGLIHGLLPDARIIHCRRHPVDTALSLYFTRFLNRHHFTTDRADLVSYHRDYQRLMEHWRRLLPADRLLEIDYERLISDSESEIRKMIEFCGLPWDAACVQPGRQDGAIRTASAWQARQPIYRSSAGRRHNYDLWLGEFRDLLPPADRAGI